MELIVSIVGWFYLLIIISTILIGIFTSYEIELGLEINRFTSVTEFTLGVSYYPGFDESDDKELLYPLSYFEKLEIGFFFFNIVLKFYKEIDA